MKLAWLSDLHLEFVHPRIYGKFVQELQDSKADAFLLGGDIGTSSTVCEYLENLAADLRRPIYFVLGNHDYYGNSVRYVEGRVDEIHRREYNLEWLSRGSYVLPGSSEVIGLIGEGGWADGRNGDVANSKVSVADSSKITDLVCTSMSDRLAKMQELADSAAFYLEGRLISAFRTANKGIMLAHVPPFVESCWHEGELSNDSFLPFFSSKAMGDVLVKTMKRFPQKELLVLCGHTHSPGEAQILPNLRVLTAESCYGQPQIQQIFDLDDVDSIFNWEKA